MKQVVLHTMKVWCVHIFGNTYFKFYFEKSNVDIYCMQIFIGSFVGCREVLRLLMFFLLNGFKVGLCIMAQLYHILVLLVMVTYSTSHTIFLSWFLKLASWTSHRWLLVSAIKWSDVPSYLLQFLNSQRNIRSVLVLSVTL